MTYQGREGDVPGAGRRANDLEAGRWGHRRQRSQAHDYHGYGGDPLRGKSIPYEPDYDRCMRVANVPALAPGDESGDLTVYWPHGGLVVGMQGTTLGVGTPEGQASIGVKLTIGDGRESVFVSGGTSGATTDAYTSLSSLCGAFNERRFLLKRPVYPTLSWTIQLKNFNATATLTPEIVFFLDSDPGDIRRHYFKSIAVPQGTIIEVFSQRGSRVIDTSDEEDSR